MEVQGGNQVKEKQIKLKEFWQTNKKSKNTDNEIRRVTMDESDLEGSYIRERDKNSVQLWRKRGKREVCIFSNVANSNLS